MKRIQISILIFLILAATFITFLPSLNNGFIGGDDFNYVMRNPLIRDLSWQGIKNIFTSVHLGLYKPLTMLSFALEYHFFNLNPYIYHLTNLIMHLLNTLLVFWLMFLISRRAWTAFLVALLFGIHPLHVESVAWVSERKDMLYSIFFLSGLIAYVYSLRYKRRIYHYLIAAMFILSLMVKPMGLTFPFMLLLCDYILGFRVDMDNLKRKAFFFAISAIFLIFTLIFASGYSIRQPSFMPLDGIFIANYALLFYLSKIILPVKLCALYPYPQKAGNLLPFIFLVSPLFVLILTGLVIFSRRYTRKIIFGILFYLICLLPVLQLIPTGNAIVCDRYTYLASIGIFYLVAESLFWVYNKRIKYIPLVRIFSVLLLAAVIAWLSSSSWNRCKVWKDGNNWFDDVLKAYPPEIGEEVRFYREEIRRNPRSPDAYNNLAIIYGRFGSHEGAIILCKAAIKMNPNSAKAYNNLGAAYGFSKDFEKSIEFSKKSIALDPNFVPAYNNLAAAYYFTGEYDLAIKYSDMAVKLGFEPDPEFLKELNKYRR